MNIQEAMEFLDGAKIFGSILGLNTITLLMEELGNPQDKLKFVHIAGTNGKGSTAAFVSSVLTKAGYNTGLYISPFIQNFGERICANGKMITDEELCRYTEQVKEACDKIVARGVQHPTEFELITAVGFLFFADRKSDIVVLEVGLGGRMDATNVIKAPEVAVICNIGFDHTEYLGNTLPLIAGEKGGIIKTGSQVVLYGQTKSVEDTIDAICREKTCDLTIARAEKAVVKEMKVTGTVFDYGGFEGLKLTMAGKYQVPNAVTAIEALKALRLRGWNIPDSAFYEGLEAAVNIGRFELMRTDPIVVVDGAHNPQGIDALKQTLLAVFPGEKFNFIVGMLADKDYETSIKEIAPLAKSFSAITPPNSRSLSSDKMAAKIKEITGIEATAYEEQSKALDTVIGNAGKDEIICIFGSLYQIGDIRRYFGK